MTLVEKQFLELADLRAIVISARNAKHHCRYHWQVPIEWPSLNIVRAAKSLGRRDS
jgi:hypothetical protein